ncbi:MAG: ABC transporter substrate-binding protein [Acidobacteria bacterium]|nr:ABC transporter substrate-binding protein [Acidobacteriota bacterium]
MREWGAVAPRVEAAGWIPAVLAWCLIGSLLSAPAQPTPPGRFPLRLAGSDGHVVELRHPPQRIVLIDSGAVEILFALGEGKRVVGAHDFLSYPPEAAGIARVGGAFNLDFEKILQLQPDLVCIFFDRFVPELRRLKVPALFLQPPSTLREVVERMQLWGDIVGRRQAADDLARQFQRRVDAVRQRMAIVRKGPRIFHDAAPGLWTLGAGTLAHEIYTLLKADNIFADLKGSQQVSPEEIVMRDPQVILCVHAKGPELFRSDPAFRSLMAVRAGRVFFVNPDLISIGGPRLAQGIEELEKIFYGRPGLQRDVD